MSGKLPVTDATMRGGPNKKPTVNIASPPRTFSSIVCNAISEDQGQFKNDSPLHTAVRMGNTTFLERLLKKQRKHKIMDLPAGDNVKAKLLLPEYRNDVDPLGDDGETPFHLACSLDFLEAVQLLVNAGCNVHLRRKCYHQLHAVHIAAAVGSCRLLKYLLTEAGNSYSRREKVTLTDTEGSTCLHWAVQGRHKDCIILLLEQGASVDVQQRQGFLFTPLHLACHQSLLDVVEMMLVARPYQFSKALELTDYEGLTPLHRAVVIDSAPILTFLLNNGGDSNYQDAEGRTPLALAASRGAWNAFVVLLKSGADILERDHMKRTCLHIAAIHGTCPEEMLTQLEVERLVLDQEQTGGTRFLDYRDILGATALHYAAACGSTEVVGRLIELGANVKIKNNNLRSVLHYASQQGFLHIIKLLADNTKASVLINDADSKGLTCLTLATQYGHLRTAEYLLSKGAVVLRDRTGQTCLHYAAAKSRTDIIDLIMLHHSVTIDQMDCSGNTALHKASLNNAADAVACLLTHGALLQANHEKQTPIDIGISENYLATLFAFINDDRWREFLNSRSDIYGTVALGLTEHVPVVMEVIYDFAVLLDPILTSPQGRQLNLLEHMVRLNRTELLTHVLPRVLVDRKWHVYGFYCHTSLTALYLLFLALINFVAILGVKLRLIPYLLKMSASNAAKHNVSIEDSPGFQEWYKSALPSDEVLELFLGREYFCLILILILWLILIVKQVVELNFSGWKFFLSIAHIIEISMCCCCVTFAAGNLYEITYEAHVPVTWQFGALTVFLSWVNLLQYYQPYGFGIYSVMFYEALGTLVKVSLFYFLLIAGAAVTFYELLPSFIFPDDQEYYAIYGTPDIRNVFTPHFTLETSAMRVGAMTIGDLDAIENFISPLISRTLPFPVTTYIFCIIFFLTMPILLNNLLTGLAIGDIGEVLKTAGSVRLQKQTEVHVFIEQLIPQKYRKKLRNKLEMYEHYPNRQSRFMPKLSNLFYGWLDRNVRDRCARSDGLLKGLSDQESHAAELAELKLQLNESSKKMDTMLKKMEKLLEASCSQPSVFQPELPSCTISEIIN